MRNRFHIVFFVLGLIAFSCQSQKSIPKQYQVLCDTISDDEVVDYFVSKLLTNQWLSSSNDYLYYCRLLDIEFGRFADISQSMSLFSYESFILYPKSLEILSKYIDSIFELNEKRRIIGYLSLILSYEYIEDMDVTPLRSNYLYSIVSSGDVALIKEALDGTFPTTYCSPFFSALDSLAIDFENLLPIVKGAGNNRMQLLQQLVDNTPLYMVVYD